MTIEDTEKFEAWESIVEKFIVDRVGDAGGCGTVSGGQDVDACL